MREEEPITEAAEALEAGRQWLPLLHRVQKQKIPVVVAECGIPLAAVVSLEDLQRLQQFAARREQDFMALDASWKAFEGVPLDDMEDQVAAALADARAELREKATRRIDAP